MINRPIYINLLRQTINNGLVKILVGVRRSGKSTILELLKDLLLNQSIKKDHIIEINFEMIENEWLKDKQQLHTYIKKQIKDKEKYYLMFDEVQEIPIWAKVINSLNVTFNVDIYATGSNARIFTGEHLTYLAGRYMSINVYPLAYEEYLTFKDLKNDVVDYRGFLDSSFPRIVLEQKVNIKNIMKQDMFETIFQRDIILRGKIQNENVFLRVARFILEHIGSMISINKIKNTLVSDGLKISYDAVENYMNLLIKSYFLYPCLRYDVKGKEILKSNCKYYVVDFGIREKLIPNKDTNTGRILENFVYLELIKHGYDVYVGKIGRDYEIDFVAIKDSVITYIQVSESIVDESTREREVKAFRYLKDNYKRIIVTFDMVIYPSSNYQHMNVFDFIKTL